MSKHITNIIETKKKYITDFGNFDFTEEKAIELDSEETVEKVCETYPHFFAPCDEKGVKDLTKLVKKKEESTPSPTDEEKSEEKKEEGDDRPEGAPSKEDEELAKQLAKSTVDELKNMCKELGLNEDDYKSLNKAPLIKFIVENSQD